MWQHRGSGPSLFEGSCRRYLERHSVVGWGVVAGDPRGLTEVNAARSAGLDVELNRVPTYRAVKFTLASAFTPGKLLEMPRARSNSLSGIDDETLSCVIAVRSRSRGGPRSFNP